MDDAAARKERRRQRRLTRKSKARESSGVSSLGATRASETSLAIDPFEPVLEKGLLNDDPEYWEKSLPGFQAAWAQSGKNDPEMATSVGWGLMRTYQWIKAEEQFRSILKSAPDTVGADLGYFISLKELDREADAINFGRQSWHGKKNRGFCYYISESLFNLGNVQQAKDFEDQWWHLAPVRSETWVVRGLIAASMGDWKEASDCFTLLLNNGVLTPKVVVNFLWMVCKANGEAVLEENEVAYIKKISNPFDQTIWTRYQLSRWSRCQNVEQLFEGEPENPMILPVNFDSSTITSDRNLNLLGDGDEDSHDGALKDPVVVPDSLRENIAAFMDIASGLIEDGAFDLWRDNFGQFRDAFAPGAQPPVFVMSSGRCGTLALLRLLERSNNVLGFHTLLMYVANIDRNHILYRILESRFDKEVLKELLGNYLQTRAAEWFYALRQGKTPVVVNHLDTPFAPFNAVFHPESRFLHLHRDDARTYQSLLTKNQWGGQLQHWRYDPAFPEGRFVCRPDEGLSIEEHIAWYLNVTRVFSEAFMDTIAPGRSVSVRSEDLFKQDLEAFADLKKVLPIDDVPDDGYRENFARPINAKESLVDKAVADTEDRHQAVRRALECLREKGVVR